MGSAREHEIGVANSNCEFEPLSTDSLPTITIARTRSNVTQHGTIPAKRPSLPIISLTTAGSAVPSITEKINMRNAKEVLKSLNDLDGYVGAALVDSESGMMLASDGGGSFNFEIAAAGNTEVVRAKRKVARALGLKDEIEDILITLGKQYHLIRPVATKPGLFFYMVLDRARSNLAMSRYKLADVEKELM
jgi:predicted regulator of Ras-like GTPase activity (Roadblock/LC7/MglB family)